MNTERLSLTKQLYNMRFGICQKDVELRKWVNIQFGLDIDEAGRWCDTDRQRVLNAIDELTHTPKIGARVAIIEMLGKKWVEAQLNRNPRRVVTTTIVNQTWYARRNDLIRAFSGCRTSGLSQLTANEGEQLQKYLETRIDGTEPPTPQPWKPAAPQIVEAVGTPFLDLERIPQLLYPVALLPSITVTAVEYGCEEPFPHEEWMEWVEWQGWFDNPVLHIPVEIDYAPLPEDQRRTNRDITVRVETVEDEITVGTQEINIPFKANRPSLEDVFGVEITYLEKKIGPAKVLPPIILPTKEPKAKTRSKPVVEKSPRYILRQFIASCESKRIQEYTRRRYDVMGHTNLNNATDQQLGDYAASLGFDELALTKLFIKHAALKSSLTGKSDQPRRLGGAA